MHAQRPHGVSVTWPEDATERTVIGFVSLTLAAVVRQHAHAAPSKSK